jgi:O-succinylbenzoic acid--CoA ligase
MTTLSLLDAARAAPSATALFDGDRAYSFGELAERCQPFLEALRAAHPPALALIPRADVASLLWLYAAFETGTPVLTLHQRATEAERRAACELVGAVPETDLSPATSAALSAVVPTPDSPALFIPTSGSTGTPRLVELSRGALVASAAASAANLGWEPHDAWLLCLPLAHTGGLSVVIRCLLGRRAVRLFEPGDAGLSARLPELAAALEQSTLVSLVPSVLSALLDAGQRVPRGLRAVLLGGAACAPALAQRAHAAGWPLLTSYGLTETASQVVTRRYAERFDPLPERFGIVSSGHSLLGVELSLREPSGRLAIRAPSLLTRHVGSNRPAVDAEGWLLTNDLGELGPAGELFVRGRSDDVIISGGENIDPLEVEAALLELPGVNAACVCGTSSARFGQIVSALIVGRDPSLAEPTRLAELLHGRLARHKLPRRALLTENLPLTLAGKLDRRACRELLEHAFTNDC